MDDEEEDSIIESSSEEEEKNDQQKKIVQPKLLPVRATRGTRGLTFTREEAEADEEFWGQDAWNVEDDNDYSTEEEEADMFDSDFEEEENPDDEVHDGDVDKRKTRDDTAKNKQTTYKDPYKKPTTRKAKTIPKIAPKNELTFIPTQRELRHSTTNKTITSVELREEFAARETEKTQKKKPEPKKRFTQRELLAEAVQTEIFNTVSLKQLQRMEDEKKADAGPKLPYTGNMIRYHSKIGEPKTITFVMDELPSIFNQTKPKPRSQHHRRHHHPNAPTKAPSLVKMEK